MSTDPLFCSLSSPRIADLIRSADVYRHMNFDQIAEFKEVADTVTV
ncbi:MAG: hypothetical protein Q8O34_11410 [Rhodocyclaceae bacterium]|nr:hypothetical protein [Rhodocyclaceae bacterium]